MSVHYALITSVERRASITILNTKKGGRAGPATRSAPTPRFASAAAGANRSRSLLRLRFRNEIKITCNIYTMYIGWGAQTNTLARPSAPALAM